MRVTGTQPALPDFQARKNTGVHYVRKFVVCAEHFFSLLLIPETTAAKRSVLEDLSTPCASTQARHKLDSQVGWPHWKARRNGITGQKTRGAKCKHVTCIAIPAARRIDTLPAKAVGISILCIPSWMAWEAQAAGTSASDARLHERAVRRPPWHSAVRRKRMEASGFRPRCIFTAPRQRAALDERVVKRSTPRQAQESPPSHHPSSVCGAERASSASSSAVQCLPVKSRSCHAVHSTVDGSGAAAKTLLDAVSRSDGPEGHHGGSESAWSCCCCCRSLWMRKVRANARGARLCARLRQLQGNRTRSKSMQERCDIL
jgi:hypothetical protein